MGCDLYESPSIEILFIELEGMIALSFQPGGGGQVMPIDGGGTLPNPEFD